MNLNSEQSTMVIRAITWMISNLSYERHQALSHGCTEGSYDKEIKEYKELRSYIINEDLQSRPASDSKAVKND